MAQSNGKVVKLSLKSESKKKLENLLIEENSIQVIQGRENQGLEVFVRDGQTLIKYVFRDNSWTKVKFENNFFANQLMLDSNNWRVVKLRGKTFVALFRKDGLAIYDDSNLRKEVILEELMDVTNFSENTKIKPIIFHGVYDDRHALFVGRDNSGDVYVQMFDSVENEMNLKMLEPEVESGTIFGVYELGGELRAIANRRGKEIVLYEVASSSVVVLKETYRISVGLAEVTFERAFKKDSTLYYFNDAGLYVIDLGTKKQILYCSEFSALREWNQKYLETIQFVEGEEVVFVFSGPKGIGSCKISNRSCTLKYAEESDLKNVNVLKVLQVQIPMKVVGFYIDTLQILTVAETEIGIQNPEPNELKSAEPTPITISDDLLRKIDPTLKIPTVRWWGETFGETIFKEAVNRNTGRLSFAFPLVDIQSRMGIPIQVSAFYEDSEEVAGGALGASWKLEENFIVVDRKGTVFEELHEYYLVRGNRRARLLRDFEGSNGKVVKFSIVDMKDLKIELRNGDEQWVVEDTKLRYIFGKDGSREAISRIAGWENWLGLTTENIKNSNLQRVPYAWHLLKIVNVHDESDKLSYFYKVENNSADSLVTNLEKITDEVNHVVEFKYDSLTKHPKINSDLLTGVTIKTPWYNQTLSLDYDNNYLKSIKQFNRTMLSFSFKFQDGRRRQLSEVILPSSEKVNYEYQNVVLQKEEVKFGKSDIFIGSSSYLLETKLETRQITVQTRDLAGKNNFVRKKTCFVNLADKFESFKAIIEEAFFVIISYFEKSLSLNVFRMNESSKNFNKTYSMSKNESKIQTGFNYILIHDQSKLYIYHWNDNLKSWQTASHLTNNHISTVFINRGLIYLTEDYQLKICWWNHAMTKVLRNIGKKLSNFAKIEEIFSRIELDPKKNEKYIQQTKQFLKNHSISVLRNLIAVRSIELTKKGLFKIHVHLFLLSKSYDLTSYQMITLNGDDLRNFQITLDGEIGDIPTKITFKYKMLKSSMKYQLYVDKVDPLPEEKKLSDYADLADEMQIPIDFEQYFLNVNADFMFIMNHAIKFEGGSFKAVPLDKDELQLKKINVNIGEEYLLFKSLNDTEIKLVSKITNITLYQFRTHLAQNITIRYPTYIAEQFEDNMFVIPLNVDRTTPFTLTHRTVHPASIPQLLLTKDKRGHVYGRTPRAIQSNSAHSVVSMTTISGLGQPHKTRYEYLDPAELDTNIYFLKTRVIPGGSKNFQLGYFVQRTDFVNGTNDVQVFDSEKQLFDKDYLSRLEAKSRKEREEQSQELNDDPRTVIWDKSRRFPIVRAAPFLVGDEVVGYMGFEDYEVKGRWVFRNDSIMKNQFSATGRNYLRLKKGESISVTFTPKSYSGIFVMRTCVRPTLKYDFKGFHAKISNILSLTTSGSLVKPTNVTIVSRLNEWYTLQALINMTDSTKSQVTLQIRADSFEIHVDHTLFAPLDLNFEAIVYDSYTSLPTEVIRNNGRVTQFINDSYGKNVVELFESGRVKIFESYQKHSNSPRDYYTSSLVVKPKNGILVPNTPYTMQNYWEFAKKDVAGIARQSLKLRGILTYKTPISSDSIWVKFQYGFLIKPLQILVGSTNLITLDRNMIPSSGHLTVFIIPKFFAIWLDESLIKHGSGPRFNMIDAKLSIHANVVLSNIIVADGAEFLLTYHNRDSNPIQEIQLSDSSSNFIRQTLYDEIGRKSKQSLWMERSLTNEPFDFKKIIQINDRNSSGYHEFFYHDIPLDIQRRVNQPGNMSFTSFKINSTVAYIQYHYPISKGFRHTEERKQNGALNVQVENKQNLPVAEYFRTEDYNNLLTTYDYDSGGNLIQVLPPNHHENHDGYDALNESNSSPWEIKSEYYNNSKLLRTRRTPDTGKMEFLYNENDHLQFQFHYDDAGKLDRIRYSLYNLEGRTREFGLLDPSFENRLRSKESFDRGNTFMQFSYGEEDSVLRNRMLYVFKQIEKQVQEEVFLFDGEENLISRDVIFNEDIVANRSMQFFYENEKISTIRYPTKLTVFYSHNSRGEMTSITDNFGTKIASFTHDPQGKVATIVHEAENFTVTYLYDIAGHLLQIKSPFLEEAISHQDGGYGANPVGDGTILRTEFRALWHDKCDQSRITLKVSDFVGEKMNYELADRCFKALKEKLVIDGLGRPVKTFYPELYDDLPIRCFTRAGGRHVAKTVMSKGFPLLYGHAYKYGSHGELTEAKSFVQDERDSLSRPLTFERFHEEFEKSKLDGNATSIWDALVSDNVISGSKTALQMVEFHEPVFNLKGLDQVLNRLFLFKESNTKRDFENLCSKWMLDQKLTNMCKRDATSYIPKLNSKFKNIANHAKIIKLLAPFFATELGKSPADVHSFSIDKNGNHKLFYTGFERYEMKYKPFKNQIESIKISSHGKPTNFILEHNSDGNVIRADHKGISRIEYDHLVQRASKIVTSKVTVELSYDYKGERTSKFVRNKSGDLLLKLHYVRDPKGNVLVELKHEYPDPKQTDKPIVTVTSYIRGPLGLIGFYRNNEYYSILQDHEGSTRLVVKGGQVIAAYDYLPYGQLIRRFNSDPDGHITYLYTGQEFDEETGLYNYHARLYDPDLGRFYQVDPQEQYPSPYKYAGNSPISLVDPDGEFAFTLFLICLGFFLAGAAHSNTFDVSKWDFKDPMLYLSMFGGIVGGLAAGMGAAASVSFFTLFFSGSSVAGHLVTGILSVAGALFGAAGASNEWNPAKWDWTSPKIWSGLFGGATVAINLPGAYLGILRTMAFLGKTVYKTTLPVLLIGFGYLGGSMANDWEFNPNKWSKGPKTFFALLDATTMSLITISTPMKLAKPVKSLTRLILHKKDLVLRGIKVASLKQFNTQTNRLAVLHVVFLFTKNINLIKMLHKLETKLLNSKLIGKSRIKREAIETVFNSANQHQGFISKISLFFNLDWSNSTVSPSKETSLKLSPTNPKESQSQIFSRYCYRPTNFKNHVICSQPNSQISVYPKAKSFEEINFGQDTFSRCMPIHWHGLPSVSCEGERSTFIYTPNDQVTVFNYLDGWIMLAGVAPAIFADLKRGFSYLTNVFRKDVKQNKISQNLLNRIQENLRNELKLIETVLKAQDSFQNYSTLQILRFLKDDVEEFLTKCRSNFNLHEYEMILERLEAFEEEVKGTVNDTSFEEIVRPTFVEMEFFKIGPSFSREQHLRVHSNQASCCLLIPKLSNLRTQSCKNLIAK
uniref:Tox-SGS domain-containing protein n=1 Tax=Culex quinquefasciatus TaxID=7176 RepID=A0A904MW34_CULQU